MRTPTYDVPLKRLRGDGVYRRFLEVRGAPGRVTARLEDDFHAFEATVTHEGGSVTDVRGRALRVPWTPCDQAGTALRALVGTAITRDMEAAAAQVAPETQCTHWLDTACLAIAAAAGGVEARRYSIAVGEPTSGIAGGAPTDARRSAELARDGQALLAWELQELTVHGRAPFEEVGLLGEGFRRALGALPDDDLREAAWLLRRAAFVSYARLYDMDRVTDARAFGAAIGASCHTFRPGMVEEARRVVGATRDFTDLPDGP